MYYQLYDLTPDMLTLCFAILSWYADVYYGADGNDEVREWGDNRAAAIMDLIPNDADSFLF